MTHHGQLGHGWTVVLRRQPRRIVNGEAEGYTDLYELICCYCGDDPWVDYREVPAEFRQIRGPYPFTAGIAAYARHVSRFHSRTQAQRSRYPAEGVTPTEIACVRSNTWAYLHVDVVASCHRHQ